MHYTSFLQGFEASLPQENQGEATKIFKELRLKIGKFSGFAAAIASAKDPEELDKVIESYAAGRTIYRSKYRLPFSLASNSYLGVNFAGNLGEYMNWGA